MHVIATAGHVDHGKSTLVRELTGMEPDRWAEERRRGMTIDLGYAWTRLPSGEQVAFVDVPGHERFATNMLAGVGPVPAVMLVIAADEGWCAQTEDHVRALDALGVRHGVLAVTRSDLGDAELAIAEARLHLEGTALAGIPAVAVSGVTGDGVDRLRAALDGLVAGLPRPDPAARVRLWIDRCFTIRGSGTVVTGTLPAGTLHPGETVELRGRQVGIRALQCLGEPVDAAHGTARVAVNLRGVEVNEVRRGDTLLTPSAWRMTRIAGVRVDGLRTPPAHVVVHIGSAAVPAIVRPLPGGRDGDAEVVRLLLSEALPLQVGDRLLLRDPGRHATVGGATVLDPAPPPFRRRGDARARAAVLLAEHGEPDVAREVARRGAVRPALLTAIGVPAPAVMPPSVVVADGWLVDRALWTRWLERLDAAVDAGGDALRDSGIGRAEAARLIGLPDPPLLSRLLEERPALEQVEGRIRRRGAAAALRPDVARAVESLLASLREQPFNAPEQSQLAALGLGRRELGAAAAAGSLLVLAGDVVLAADAAERAVEVLRLLEQPFTLSAARQALGTTRRVAVPLLEQLERMRLTERVDGGLHRVHATVAARS